MSYKPKPKKKTVGRPKNKTKIGRPRVMDDKMIAELEYAFSIGCSDGEACAYAGICRQTLYTFQLENPDFVDRKEQLKQKPILKARTTIIKALNSDNLELAKWFLERKRKHEFSTKIESESQVTTVNRFSMMTEEQLDAYIKANNKSDPDE